MRPNRAAKFSSVVATLALWDTKSIDDDDDNDKEEEEEEEEDQEGAIRETLARLL